MACFQQHKASLQASTRLCFKSLFSLHQEEATADTYSSCSSAAVRGCTGSTSQQPASAWQLSTCSIRAWSAATNLPQKQQVGPTQHPKCLYFAPVVPLRGGAGGSRWQGKVCTIKTSQLLAEASLAVACAVSFHRAFFKWFSTS